MTSEIRRIIIDTKAFSNELVRAAVMPFSLKETYYSHHYGIFAE